MITSLLNQSSRFIIESKKKLITTFIILLQIVVFSLPVLNANAQELNPSQKAMKIAESQTNGKAVGSKYVQEGKKIGYKVRILKDGKVSHVFVAIEKVQ